MLKQNNFVGIDIGCSQVKLLAQTANSNAIMWKQPISNKTTKSALIGIITTFCNRLSEHPDSMGIAISGTTLNGMEVSTTSLNYLKSLKARDFKKIECDNIHFITKANAMALKAFSENPNSKVLLALTSDPELGVGIVINGQLFTGASGFAGEICNTPMIGKNGGVTKVGNLISAYKVSKCLDSEKDIEEKEEELEIIAKNFGMVLTSLIHCYNPDTIYFSGDGFSSKFLDRSIHFTKKFTTKHFLSNLRFVRPTRESNFTGAEGALIFSKNFVDDDVV